MLEPILRLILSIIALLEVIRAFTKLRFVGFYFMVIVPILEIIKITLQHTNMIKIELDVIGAILSDLSILCFTIGCILISRAVYGVLDDR